MRYVFIILLLSISNSHAALTGSGTLSIGLSQLQDSTEMGADFDYQLVSDSAYQKTQVSLMTEYSSDSSNVQLFNDHSRLYDGETTAVSINNFIPLSSSLINWVTKSNFYSEKLSITSTKDEDWYWDTGPEYKKYLRRDVLLETAIKSGISNINNLRSNNLESDISIKKSVSRNKTLGIMYRNICWNYTSVNEVDSCNLSYGIAFGVNTRNGKFDLEVGESKVGQSKSMTYIANYSYNLNSQNSINLNISNESKNILSSSSLVILDSVNSENITVDSRKFEYVKILSRTSLSLRFENTEYSSNENVVEIEKIKDIKINHRLNNSICRSCSVILLNKSNKVNELEWEVLALGVEYPLSRNLMLNMMFRQSKDEILGEYKSLNLQIRYNGTDQHLALN